MSTIEQQVTDAFNGKGWPQGKDGASMLMDAAIELRRLRGELSLAEEGLANYAQEVEELRGALDRVRDADSVEEAFRIAVEALGSPPQDGKP